MPTGGKARGRENDRKSFPTATLSGSITSQRKQLSHRRSASKAIPPNSIQEDETSMTSNTQKYTHARASGTPHETPGKRRLLPQLPQQHLETLSVDSAPKRTVTQGKGRALQERIAHIPSLVVRVHHVPSPPRCRRKRATHLLSRRVSSPAHLHRAPGGHRLP